MYRAKNNAADLDYYNCGDIKLMFIEIFGCFSLALAVFERTVTCCITHLSMSSVLVSYNIYSQDDLCLRAL